MQRLYRFLAAKDNHAARRAVQKNRADLKILAHQPHVGRPIDDMEHHYREWPVDFGDSGYMMLYRPDGETAAILAVRHQREAGY